jgi:hypothetical protein
MQRLQSIGANMSLNEQNPNLSRVLIAEQSAKGTKKALATDLVRAVYETPSSEIAVRQNQLTPQRISGYRSQIRNAQGRWVIGGSFTVFAHVVGLGMWLKHLMTGTVSTSQTAAQEIKASGGVSIGVPFSLTTQPNATSPAVNPAKLEFNLSGISGSDGTMIITGTNENDHAITETINISGTPAQIVSTKYFKTVNANGMIFSAITCTLQMNGDPGTWEHTFKLGNEPLDGLTVEVDKGQVPNHYWDIVPNEGTITIPSEDVVQCVFGLMGTNYLLDTAIDGGSTPIDITGWAETGRLPAEIFSEGMGALTINAIAMDVQEAELTINNNFIQHPGANGTRNPAFPNAISLADVIFNVTVPYLDHAATSTPDIDRRVEEDGEWAVDYTHTFTYQDGPEYKFNVNMPRVQFPDLTDPFLSVGGRLVRNVICRPLASLTQTDSDEITVKLTNGSENLDLTGWSTI